MGYVARIVRKDGSLVEQPVKTQQEGQQWVAQNTRPGDKGHAVVKKW